MKWNPIKKASIMKQSTIRTRKNNSLKEMKDIQRKIRKASADGCFQLLTSITYSETYSALLSQGYSVEKVNNYRGPVNGERDFKISWK